MAISRRGLLKVALGSLSATLGAIVLGTGAGRVESTTLTAETRLYPMSEAEVAWLQRKYAMNKFREDNPGAWHEPTTGIKWTAAGTSGRMIASDDGGSIRILPSADCEGWFPLSPNDTHMHVPALPGLRSLTNLATGATITFPDGLSAGEVVALP